MPMPCDKSIKFSTSMRTSDVHTGVLFEFNYKAPLTLNTLILSILSVKCSSKSDPLSDQWRYSIRNKSVFTSVWRLHLSRNELWPHSTPFRQFPTPQVLTPKATKSAKMTKGPGFRRVGFCFGCHNLYPQRLPLDKHYIHNCIPLLP